MATFRLGPNSKPAELLAALGEALGTFQDRDHLYIAQRRRLVPHQTARRDYMCRCGSGLVTRFIDGDWRTVCAADPTHGQDQFVSQASYHAELARGAAEAAEVFAGLPPELQRAIKGEEV